MTAYVVDTTGPLHRILRSDGRPLCTEPPPPLDDSSTDADTWADALERLRRRDEANTRFYHQRRLETITRQAQEARLAAPLTGAVLAAWRRAAGLTQRQLAARLGTSRGLVAEVETDRRAAFATRLRLAAALGHPAEGVAESAVGAILQPAHLADTRGMR